MIYSSILRELDTRLKFQADGRLLAGLNIKKAGEWSIEGNQDLPQLTLVDLSAADTRGRSTGQISMFLTTNRENDWFKADETRANGLIDWMELVMDAVETKPSDGLPDVLLIAHNHDGTPKLDVQGAQRELLVEPLQWDTRMAEIRTLSFTLQMDFVFALATTSRGKRRDTPFRKPE